MQLPPQAPLSHDRAGGKKGPPPPPSAVLSSPLPLGSLTLKAKTLAHPEAPGDVIPSDPCTFIKHRVFVIGGENTNLSLTLLPPLSLSMLFHSRALTEAVYRSGFNGAVRSESAADLSGGRARERATTFQCWLCWTGPRGGHAVPSERALSVQLLTLKWKPCYRLCKGPTSIMTQSREEKKKKT